MGAEVAALEVRDLDAAYGQVQVLFGASLAVGEGEAVALVGTNGAGKSTLLKAISGLVPATAGDVLLDGRSVRGLSAPRRARQGIVHLVGGAATFPPLTVAENLAMAGYALAPARRRARTEEVVADLPVLGERLGDRAAHLSGGQQHLLALAMALVQEPRVLLVDELSLGLAPVAVQQVLEVVARLRAAQTTMVLVEQSLNVALAIVDRAVFMERGEVRFTGSPAELARRDDLVRAVFFRDAG